MFWSSSRSFRALGLLGLWFWGRGLGALGRWVLSVTGFRAGGGGGLSLLAFLVWSLRLLLWWLGVCPSGRCLGKQGWGVGAFWVKFRVVLCFSSAALLPPKDSAPFF